MKFAGSTYDSQTKNQLGGMMPSVHIDNRGQTAIVECAGRFVRNEAAFKIRDTVTSHATCKLSKDYLPLTSNTLPFPHPSVRFVNVLGLLGMPFDTHAVLPVVGHI